MDYSKIKLSDFIQISDTDVTYGGTKANGICNDCKARIKGKSLRCTKCKIIINREISRIHIAKKRARKKQCSDCGMEITRFRRCLVCRDKREKELKRITYENDLKASKFYVPPVV